MKRGWCFGDSRSGRIICVQVVVCVIFEQETTAEARHVRYSEPINNYSRFIAQSYYTVQVSYNSCLLEVARYGK